MLHYINRNYAMSISLEQLGERFNCSPSYISRLFNRKAQISLHGYVNQRRIDTAKIFLLNTKMSIQEITCAIGFSDANYFSTVFRRLCGVSPREWRNEQLIAQNKK